MKENIGTSTTQIKRIETSTQQSAAARPMNEELVSHMRRSLSANGK